VSCDTARSFLATDPCCRLRAIRILRLPESRLKRRDFLAASALLSLLVPSSALAANKKKAAAPTAAKPVAKGASKVAAGKASPKATATKSSGRASTRRGGRHTYRPVVETPATPPAAAASPPPAALEPRNAISLPDEPLPQWRTYDITTRPSRSTMSKARCGCGCRWRNTRDTLWQRSLGHSWRGNFDSARHLP
jgi:hypothetical protein